MRLISIPFIFIALLFIGNGNLTAQCTINSCPNPTILSGNISWVDGTQGASNGFLTVTDLTLGNIDCLVGPDPSTIVEAGVEIYIYQLLPDGSRITLCDVTNTEPNNFVYKFAIGVGPASDCSDTALALPDQIFYDHRDNLNQDSGMYLCDGGVYEVVIAAYVNDTGIPIEDQESVYTYLNPDQYVDVGIGTFFVDYTGEFATPNPYPVPISLATISGPNGETGSITFNCNEEANLFIESYGYIGRCRVEKDPIPNFYPFCDISDPNMISGTYSNSIPSELETFISYSVNGGAPIIIRDGNSGNAGTEAYGGQQTGPGNLPGLGMDVCYTGACGFRTFPVPDSMCSGDVIVVTVETFDVYSNTSATDEMTITFTGEGCDDCGPVCPTSASISTSEDFTCSAFLLTITGNTVGEGEVDFAISESTGTITEISEGVPFTLPENNTCNPVTYTFNVTATCIADGSIITGGEQTASVTVYPNDVTAFITSNDGECGTSVSIDASCGTNVTVSPGTSQSAGAGTSGTHTYTVTWAGGGLGCFEDFDITANYDCPPDVVCPTSASISTSADSLCGEDMLTITGSTIGEGFANFSITESTGTITGIEEGISFSLPVNNTCEPITYTFNATVTCEDDGSTIEGSDLSIDLIIYPGNIDAFVTTTDGECSTSVSVDASCATNVSVNPAESQTAEPGTSGTHTYNVSWVGGGPGCISEFDVTANYDCPASCPSEANITATTSEVCGGEMVTITGTSMGNGSASFEITESTGAITGIIDGSPVTIPTNNTCEPITYTFNATATCDADGSPVTNGTFSLNITAYPSDIASLIGMLVDGCTTQVIVDESCAGNVLVEPESSQTAEQGDDEGTHNYTLSWIGQGSDCIAAQDIDINYSCPCEFQPQLAGVVKVGGNDPLNKVCFGESISYNSIYDNSVIDLNDGGIDIDYSMAFVIFIEPIDFAVPPSSEQIQRITNDTTLVNDGSIPPGTYYIHYFQARDTLDPAIDTANCTLISEEYCEIAILEQLSVESTVCSGFENNNEVVITVTGGDTHDPPSNVYLSNDGTQFDPVSIETTMDTVRIITFTNLPDGDYMFFYEDASACKESLLLEFSCMSSNFDCPSEIAIPDFAIGCGGETVALSANIIGESEFTTVTWSDADGNIISDPQNVALPENNTCGPILVEYTIEVNCTQNPDFIPLTASQIVTVYPTDVSAFVTASQSECETVLSIDTGCGDLVTYTPVSFNPGESGTIEVNINYNSDCVEPFSVSVNYDCPEIMGCTDPCAPSYNPNATIDDGSCEPYTNTCNQDCAAGPFGGNWDMTTCSCINEITPVNGCTDEAATNYDPAANCDDDSCTYLMCEDPCAPNFGAEGACEPYNDTCNEDCTAGPFGGTWDATSCACVDEITPVNGCTDEAATNYDPAAN